RKNKIVDLPRSFIETNGASKHIDVFVNAPKEKEKNAFLPFREQIRLTASDLNVCSKQGLSERFDSTIGAGSVLMPFGGKYQLTPSQVMVARIPTADLSHAHTCSVMSYGADPYGMAEDCYQGAYDAVMESVAKLVTSGAKVFSKGENCYFSYQEYFEKLGHDSKKWGKPFAALLGALDAQLELKIASIGGKDSMSGTFENISVPPTLVSFAVAFADDSEIITPEFKKTGHKAVLFTRDMFDSYKDMFCFVEDLISNGKVYSAYVPTYGATAAAVMKMCFGNGLGFSFDICDPETIFAKKPASIIVETDVKPEQGVLIGTITENPSISCGSDEVELNELLGLYDSKLESVFPQNIRNKAHAAEKISFNAPSHRFSTVKYAVPRVVIPVFPGTNCEYDAAHAFEQAGAKAEIFVINNLSAAGINESALRFSEAIDASQIIFIPGGFSGGDEPDGSGKFITAFFRNKFVSESVMRLLEKRDGLVGGICNGFQALIKLGLVPFGKIIEPDESSPTLTFNTIGRHVSKLVTTRVASNMSPWYSDYTVGELHTMPVSHGEGRFVCSDELFSKLKANGQIATQYCTPEGEVSMDIRFNPNGSFNAVEGITSPDGRVFGKMGHSERWCQNAYKNVPGNNDMKLFTCGVKYFK
ncbi:MAG TPA: phosphoribosylformylglycinamidine synthase subunit PurQ, partial [Bacillota bacterium]|nr:phosphoribosylformylglycinamidine synthase subunit PurQ [Bacillota bacterium]